MSDREPVYNYLDSVLIHKNDSSSLAEQTITYSRPTCLKHVGRAVEYKICLSCLLTQNPRWSRFY